VKFKILLSLSFVCLICSATISAKEKRVVPTTNTTVSKTLLSNYEKNYANKSGLKKLKDDTLRLGSKAVPVLIQVMKNSKFPDKNRWIATMMLGKIMGKKSGPFIAKFLSHPSWVMRAVSLKTLLALGEKKYADLYAIALKDDSMIVRAQALDNISHLKLNKYAPNVWAMLYDKKNYHKSQKNLKRTHIVKTIITTIGDLQFKDAKDPLLKMIQKKKYDDIFFEMDIALQKILKVKSPKTSQELKRRYWKKFLIEQAVI
jgi:HEAT repeat protein